jgi:hypothetical protein
VEFLEEHPQFGFTHTDCKIKIVDSNKVIDKANRDYINSQLSHKNNQKAVFEGILSNAYIVRTATVVFRRGLFEETQQYLRNSDLVRNLPMGDTPLWLELTKYTNFWYLDEETAIYRVLKKSASKFEEIKNKIDFRLKGLELRFDVSGLVEDSA